MNPHNNPDGSRSFPHLARSYLGAHETLYTENGVVLAIPCTVRDPNAWAPGSLVTSRTGRRYTVGKDGSLRRTIPKCRHRMLRKERRDITAVLKNPYTDAELASRVWDDRADLRSSVLRGIAG